MEASLCQLRGGVTLWLCLAGSDPIASSSAAPVGPFSLRLCRDQRMGPNLGWRVELKFLWAPLTATGSEPCPTPTPEHSQILAQWRAQQCGV